MIRFRYYLISGGVEVPISFEDCRDIVKSSDLELVSSFLDFVKYWVVPDTGEVIIKIYKETFYERCKN